jgi:transcription elongation factor GreA
LGSSETNPAQNIISHNSPIGSALMGHRVGEEVVVNLKNGKVDCKIIKIK